jgi:hypothetical protein
MRAGKTLCKKGNCYSLHSTEQASSLFFIVYNFTTGEIFPAFVKPGGSLRYSQKPASVFSPGPGQCNPHPLILQL